MKILPIALCLLVVVAPSVLAAGLEGVSPTWGLGVVETGATLTNVFELRNSSGQPVTLRSVRSSCSCAAVEWPRQAVPAGSSAWVSGSFSGARRGGTRPQDHRRVHSAGEGVCGRSGRADDSDVISSGVAFLSVGRRHCSANLRVRTSRGWLVCRVCWWKALWAWSTCLVCTGGLNIP